MSELLKTIFVLSALGSILILLLLLLKPLTVKRFPAKWQYWVWVVALCAMLLPVYRLVPQRLAQTMPIPPQQITTPPENIIGGIDAPPDIVITTLPTVLEQEISITPQKSLPLWDILGYVWLTGFGIFLLVVFISYISYLARKRRESENILENYLLEATKKELGIRRKIRLRQSQKNISPMLVGIFRPTIYLPNRNIAEENLHMVFLHELTHFKRGDLLLKWLALFVNAVHWFNPLCYLLVANFSESCELSCDMAVTRRMSEEEQKLYMKTILELVEERT